MSDSEVLIAMQALIRRGAYQEAANYADKLDSGVKRKPLIALERSRVFLRQGHPINAETALATANLDLATPGEQLIIAIETAALQVYRYVAISDAISAAKAAFDRVEIDTIDPTDLAQAERIHVRIMLFAETYYEISPETGRKELNRLTGLAQKLLSAGRIDEALAARLTYAERYKPATVSAKKLSKLANEAVMLDRPNLAGEAHLVRAEQLMASGASGDEIHAALDKADVLYAEGQHIHGAIDVQRVRAKLAIERELTNADVLDVCLDAYRKIDFYRGMINTLLDLSQLAHNRGDTAAAVAYRQQLIELSDNVGMGLSRDSSQTAQIDLLIRHQDYGTAIELCQTAITTEPPEMIKAGYVQLLATVYAFLNDFDAACTQGRKAIDIFMSIQADDSASDAVMKLCSDLNSYQREETWKEAELLLETWTLKDVSRGNYAAAANKQEMIAQISIQRFLKTQPRQLIRLDEAEQAIKVSEELAHHLQGLSAARRLGNLQQLQGQIYQARQNEEGVIQCWRSALAIFDKAQLAMERANCHYILGTIYLNRANQQLMPNFDESEGNLREALTYYDSASMRGQAADTRFMFARLYCNASIQVADDLSGQMLDAALEHLFNAEADYDAIRREFKAGSSILDVRRGKRALINNSQRIYTMALEILCLFRPDPSEAWNWIQRAKARSLVDIMGMSSVPPMRIINKLKKNPDAYKLVLQEREFTIRISQVSLENRFALREELNKLLERMEDVPLLSEYLQLRTGSALKATDLAAMMLQKAESGRSCVCVDWIAIGDRLFLLAARPDQSPELFPLPLQLKVVQDFVCNNLAAETFRLTLRDTPELLRELDSLIAPLASISNPEELLILSPTGPLHALPLHALNIDNQPLLIRNPIIYCPSLSVLRHGIARRHNETEMVTAALFGDPNGNLPKAAQLVTHLEQLFESELLLNEKVTCLAFSETICDRDLVHYQGHAVHQPNDPLDSHLKFADGKLTARDVFDLPDLNAQLVTLAACESAASVIAVGDEPLGLIPAFLYAGANSVLATLWKVQQTSAAQTMRIFYDKLSESDTAYDKAEALRQAMLTVRATPDFDSPYYWAPFVLNGDWQ
ncbi:MAG: CHAT domain-containing protein [Methylococcales bacterium]